jgi:hypothetical protein
MFGNSPRPALYEELHAGSEPIPRELFWRNVQRGRPVLMAGHGEMIGALSLT